MVTLKNIAEQTGLRVSTVSDILNARSDVRYALDTVARVRRVADELGYRPNRLARSLRRGSTKMIGLVIPDLCNHYYTEMVQSMSRHLRANGYDVVLEEAPVSADVALEKHAIESIRDLRVDGMIASVIHARELEPVFKTMEASGVHLFVLGLPPDSKLQADAVFLTFESAIRDLAEHLHSLGHREYVFVGNFPWDARRGPRYHLLRENLTRLGLSGQPAISLPCEHNAEGAHQAFAAFLAENPMPRATAAVCLSDDLAIGVMRAARDAGLSVPGDLSVVGCNGTDIGRLLPIKLTTLACPIREISDIAAKSLLARLRGEKPSRPLRKTVEAKFAAGESTGRVGEVINVEL